VLAARNDRRLSYIQSLANLHRSYRGDELRREAALLEREGAELTRLLATLLQAADPAAGRPGTAAAAARGKRRTRPPPSNRGLRAKVRSSRSPIGLARRTAAYSHAGLTRRCAALGALCVTSAHPAARGES
jgi:hypothetical protein